MHRIIALALALTLTSCSSDTATTPDVATDTATTPDVVTDTATTPDVVTDTATTPDIATDTTPDTATQPDTDFATDTTPPPQTLDAHRDRLLATLAARRGDPDACATWTAMDATQRGIFLTHSDMLGNRSCTQAGCADAMVIAHVTRLWTVNGSDPGCTCTETADGYHCCNGGGEWHRTFFTADDVLIAALRAGDLPGWRASGDIAGPHAPFTQSSETVVGSPRGQVHFFARDADAVTLHRNGVDGVLEPHIVELDNDYNILHDSNPEGCYGIAGLLCSYGRVAYRAAWLAYGNAAATTLRGNGEPSPHAALAGDDVYAPTCP